MSERAGEYRVFGPPGTGKTTYLGEVIERTAMKYGSEAVMASTFTKAAALELTKSNLPIPRDQVGTLHALCYRMQGRPEIAEVHAKEWNELHPALALTPKGKANVDEPFGDETGQTRGDEIMAELQTMRAQMRPRELWRPTVQEFEGRWTAWKNENGLMDFTDMIEITLRYGPHYPPGDARIGFFDEVQDFTPVELALVRRWGENMDWLILAGDDDQCIYSFKGATPDAFLNPPVEAGQKRFLNVSHRLPRRVKRFAQRWVERLSLREPKDYDSRDEDGRVVKITSGAWKRPEPVVADAVRRHVDEGSTVMLLAACSYMLEPLKMVLKKEAIPFHNPYRKTRGDWNPLARRRGLTAGDVIAAFTGPRDGLLRHGEGHTLDELLTWTRDLKRRGIVTKEGKETLARYAAEVENVSEEIRTHHALPAAVIRRIFSEEAAAAVLALDLDWLRESLTARRRRSMEFPLKVYRRRGRAALLGDPQVTIGTIHSVKGAEADVVYLWPDLSMAGAAEWCGNARQRDSVIRQFYVGMTRARRELVLCPPASPMAVML